MLLLVVVSVLELRPRSGPAENASAAAASIPARDLAVPDHSTLSRRAETLQAVRPWSSGVTVHLIVDSTGLRICGPGEWLERSMALGRADPGGSCTSAWTPTRTRSSPPSPPPTRSTTGSQLGPLLDKVAPLASFTRVGAFDQMTLYGEVAVRHMTRQSSCRRDRRSIEHDG